MTEVFIPERLFGITGFPLGHSLSPWLHNFAMRLVGYPGVYMAFPVPPEGVGELMAAVRALPVSGMSVTIPHKRAVMQYLDAISPEAEGVGAVNTLWWDGEKLCGENTDVEGFVAPLRERGLRPASALVLGAGGASRAALVGLAQLGVERVWLTNRDVAKAERVADDLAESGGPRPEVVLWEERARIEAELLVNATPLGMQHLHEGATPWPPEACRTDQVVYDLVYAPRETPFLRHAAEAGCRVVGGIEMFLNQARRQFELFTGQEFPMAEAGAYLDSLAGG